jgi:hypothetical protein
MTDAGSPAAEVKGEREYCRFGKRNLDGMSWLAPLVNNRFGDRLNLELRHEQLFFIKGDQVLDDVGYSEKGQRFTEAQFGKPIHSLEDLKRNGYWLVGQEYDPVVMQEALASAKGRLLLLPFSNQCQDWGGSPPPISGTSGPHCRPFHHNSQGRSSGFPRTTADRIPCVGMCSREIAARAACL